MKFLADECCDAELVEALRSDGHDVFYVQETMAGAPDDEILKLAFDQERLLLTEDKDFGELVYRLRMPAHGIILLRFNVPDESQRIPRIRELLENAPARLSGNFVVLELQKTRLRPLHKP